MSLKSQGPRSLSRDTGRICCSRNLRKDADWKPDMERSQAVFVEVMRRVWAA